jgi:hypothetical protein
MAAWLGDSALRLHSAPGSTDVGGLRRAWRALPEAKRKRGRGVSPRPPFPLTEAVFGNRGRDEISLSDRE